jgi:hypothetical protein
MTVIEIRPYRNGWKVFEAPGVEPVFPSEVQAINYASNRASFRSGEIRVLDSNGNVTRTVRFSDTMGSVAVPQKRLTRRLGAGRSAREAARSSSPAQE